tara:strand:+ start:9612 stop:10391 length:780 start_codon:yes stop_codon:yes gene_type:complete
MAKRAVAKKQSTAVDLADAVGDETGMEGMGSDDFAIPFVRILQDGSPQVKKKKAEYIDGAVASMFLNSGTQEIYEGQELGIRFVPCVFQRKIVEWIPVDDGGGFVGAHELDSQVVRDAIKDGVYMTTPDGHDLVDTIYYFGQLISEDGELLPAVMAFASTQLKKARNWNNRLGSLKLEKSDGSKVNAPMWSHSWNITTVFESNEKGDWYGYKISEPEPVTLDQYNLAGDFRDLVKSGAAKMVNPSDEPVPTDEDADAFD